jgi:hypothetical protein
MIGSLMMCVSVFVLLVGMVGGLVMGIEQNFLLAPAHAHLNLVGGVLLFLFGMYYRLFPTVGQTALARIQGWLHIGGGILLPGGIALVVAVNHALVLVAVIGGVMTIAATLLFAAIVLRHERTAT